MDSTQIGLIAIGAMVIAIMFVWHWWQGGRDARLEAKASKLAQQTAALEAKQQSARVAADAMAEENAAKIAPHMSATAQIGSAENLYPQTGQGAYRAEPSLGVDLSLASAASEVTHYVGNSGKAAEQSETHTSATSAIAADHPALDQWDNVPNAALSSGATAEPVATTPQNIQTGHSANAGASVSAHALPFDERLYVHALISHYDNLPFDAAPYLAVAAKAHGWAKLTKHSGWVHMASLSSGEVHELVLALPLASRAGPIDVHEMDAWKYDIADAGTHNNGDTQFFGFRDGPERAAELDGFLAAVDYMPTAYLVKRDGGNWTGTRLRGTLEANGFKLNEDGRFMYHEVDTDVEIFAITDAYERPFTSERLKSENYSALRCVLEPVHLTQPLARFDVYRQSLRALSKLLDADLKTQQGTPLSDAVFTDMRGQVKESTDALINAGIEPGLMTAKALFS